MDCVLLNQSSEFQALLEHFKSKFAELSLQESGSGLIALRPCSNSEVVFVSWDQPTTPKMHTAMLWAHREFHPKRFISTGLADFCFDTDELYLIPKVCLRSAGRVDIEGAPVLYEEILFHSETQDQLTQLVKTETPRKESVLFSSDFRSSFEPEDLSWIRQTLGCDALDGTSGEILLMGKRLSIGVGCLKIQKKTPSALAKLVETWAKYAELKHSDPK